MCGIDRNLSNSHANRLGDLNSWCNFPTAGADVQEVTHVGGCIDIFTLEYSHLNVKNVA